MELGLIIGDNPREPTFFTFMSSTFFWSSIKFRSWYDLSYELIHFPSCIYTTIFITTIKSPDIIYERYKDIEERNQWLRRMVIKHFMFDPIKKRVYYEIEKMETTSQYFEGGEYKPIVSKEEMEQEDMKIESSSNI